MKRLFLLLAVLGCSSTTAQPGVPAGFGSLAVTGPQAGVAGQPFQLQIAALDTRGAPMDFAGAATIADSSESLSQTVSFAPADHGKQSASIALKKAGPHALTVTSGSVQASFSLPIDAGAGAALQLAGGDAQAGTAGAVLAVPLAARLTDAFGNAVAGEAVSWKVLTGAGSLSSATSTTGADGVAQVTATLDKVASAQRFQALYNTASVQFSAVGRAGPAAALVIVGGNQQRGTAGAALTAALRVHAVDQFGNVVLASSPVWTATVTGDTVTSQGTDLEGTASATAALGPALGPRSFVATLAGATSATFDATTYRLLYTAPASGGKVRLLQNVAASSGDLLVLDLVTSAPMTAFSAGMNLPVDPTRASADATQPIVPGSALPPGTSPVAAGAALLTRGPLAGVLVSVQTQKASGSGATPSDSNLAAGAVLYSLRLRVLGSAPAGVVFDGTALPASFRAAVRNKAGTDQATSADFRIGQLVVAQ